MKLGKKGPCELTWEEGEGVPQINRQIGERLSATHKVSPGKKLLKWNSRGKTGMNCTGNLPLQYPRGSQGRTQVEERVTPKKDLQWGQHSS